MTAARFLYISGACFLLAAFFRYRQNQEAAFAFYVPGIVFLACGLIALVLGAWERRMEKKK
jgi:hypothetical protein